MLNLIADALCGMTDQLLALSQQMQPGAGRTMSYDQGA